MNKNDHAHEPGQLSIDACLELLANRKRRLILGHLVGDGPDNASSDTPDHASIDTLVETICDDEAERTGERPGHDAVVTALYHVHLPKMAEAGLIEFDMRHLEIRYRGDRRTEELYSKIQEIE